MPGHPIIALWTITQVQLLGEQGACLPKAPSEAVVGDFCLDQMFLDFVLFWFGFLVSSSKD